MHFKLTMLYISDKTRLFQKIKYFFFGFLVISLFSTSVVANSTSWTQMGRDAMVQEDYTTALYDFDQAIQFNEDLAVAYNNKGVALLRLGRCNESIISLEKASILNPKDSNQLLNLALAYECSGDRDTAYTLIDSAINSSNTTSTLWTIRASLLLQDGLYADALSSVNTALEQNSSDPEAWYQKSLILTQMNDYPAAYIAIKNASNLSSVQDITVRFNQGVIEERLLKYKDAIDSYNAVLEMDPTNVKALFNKGSIYWNHYRLNESLEAYNQVVSINPEFSDAWFYRGLVLKELDNINESAKSFINAAKLKPQDRMYQAYADRYAKMMSGGINTRPTFPIPLSWSVPVTIILGLLFVLRKRDQ